MSEIEKLQQEIEARLEAQMPDVELLLAEFGGGPAGATLRLYIDRPEGVNHQLCADVTELLDDLLREYSLEVSSPGIERPLTKPVHFERFVGSEVEVHLATPLEGRRNFRGRILTTTSDGIELESDGETFSLEFSAIQRSHLIASLERVS